MKDQHNLGQQFCCFLLFKGEENHNLMLTTCQSSAAGFTVHFLPCSLNHKKSLYFTES
jgi:hypothetical protein